MREGIRLWSAFLREAMSPATGGDPPLPVLRGYHNPLSLWQDAIDRDHCLQRKAANIMPRLHPTLREALREGPCVRTQLHGCVPCGIVSTMFTESRFEVPLWEKYIQNNVSAGRGRTADVFPGLRDNNELRPPLLQREMLPRRTKVAGTTGNEAKTKIAQRNHAG